MNTHKVVKAYNGDETTVFKGTYQQCKSKLEELNKQYEYDDDFYEEDDYPIETNSISYHIQPISYENTGIKGKNVLLVIFIIFVLFVIIKEFGSVIFFVLGGGGIR